MNDWMNDWELELFANVRVQAHEVNILDCLILAHLILEMHGLCSSTIYSIAVMQVTLFCYGMRGQFRFLIHYSCIVKFTFLLNLDLISRMPLSVLIATSCDHIFS